MDSNILERISKIENEIKLDTIPSSISFFNCIILCTLCEKHINLGYSKQFGLYKYICQECLDDLNKGI